MMMNTMKAIIDTIIKEATNSIDILLTGNNDIEIYTSVENGYVIENVLLIDLLDIYKYIKSECNIKCTIWTNNNSSFNRLYVK